MVEAEGALPVIAASAQVDGAFAYEDADDGELEGRGVSAQEAPPLTDALQTLAYLVGALVTENTRLRQAEQAARAEAAETQSRLEFLTRASIVLAASIEYEERLNNLARLVVPTLADWCSIDLIEQEGSVRRLVVLHADPDKSDAAQELQSQYPRLLLDASHTITKVLTSGCSWFDAYVSPDRLAREARDTHHLDLLRRLGFGSEMVIPMLSRGRLLGTLTTVFGDSGRHYTSADLALAEDLARRAAIAIDNARLYRRAQQAIAARDEFLAIASHELKTPLTSMRLHSQYLLRRAESNSLADMPPERLLSLLRKGDKQLDQLTHIVQDLLDVSRISAGRVALNLEDVDLAAVAHDVVERFSDEADAQGSEMRLQADGPWIGRWDRFRLDQAITNIVSNALKYGRGAPIEISIGGDTDWVSVAVRDHGVGIAPADVERIFDRFARAIPDEGLGGLGLGLYISRQFVEAHGGRIRVQSTPGLGSTFTIDLPRRPPAHEEPTARDSLVPAPG
ncbi:MAG: HAMP domain-containing sensor histidine kinase [Anaerolineae bacterium]